MADAAAKQFSIDGSGDTLIPDLKTMFSLFRTRRTKIFLYGFMFTFFACTLFLAFSPSTGNNSSSPWFSNIFSSSSQSDYRSHFSSFFSHFFPNSSFMPSLPSGSHGLSGNQTVGIPLSSSTSMKMNQTVNGLTPKSPKEEEKQSVVKQKNGNFTSGVVESKPSEKQKEKKTENIEDKSNSSVGVLESKPLEKKTGKALDKKEEKSKVSSGVTESMPSEKKTENLFDSLMNCNIFDGRWVKDDSYPLYASGSCPHIDEPFNCYLNGRPDADYQKLRWKPNGCNVPRLDGKKMLELLRGKRLVFIGDSLNRNMWESLVCILRNSVEDKSKVFEASGRIEFRTEGSYSFVFQDYNCSVEFFRSPFLVQEWEMPESNGTKKETLRLDLVESSSSKYRNADVIVFNTGHWWTHEKTSKGKNYYQEGDHVYGKLNVVDAFHKALLTWARWVDANVNPSKTTVFFRGYSASHFRGGRWNSGGQCDSETQPIKNETYLASYPSKMKILEDVMNDMKTPVFYLNITRLTDYRKDAHPSIYRKQKLSEEERRSPLRYQDCSHWCLPGVPDVWNELLYAQLLIKQHDKNHHPQQFQPQQQQQKGH